MTTVNNQVDEMATIKHKEDQVTIGKNKGNKVTTVNNQVDEMATIKHK